MHITSPYLVRLCPVCALVDGCILRVYMYIHKLGMATHCS